MKDPEKRRQAVRKLQSKYLSQGLCRCGREIITGKVCSICRERNNRSYQKYKEKRKLNMVEYRQSNPEKFERYNFEHRVKLHAARDLIYNTYGNQCACCKESNPIFFQLDHVNNDGAKHRKIVGRNNLKYYRWIIKNNFPSSLQILCANCNFAKTRVKICPHQECSGKA